MRMDIVKLSCLGGRNFGFRVPDTETMILPVNRGYLYATIIAGGADGIVIASLPSLEGSISELPDFDGTVTTTGRGQAVPIRK